MEITRYQQTQQQIPNPEDARRELKWCVIPDRSIVAGDLHTSSLHEGMLAKTRELELKQLGTGMMLVGLAGISGLLSDSTIAPLTLASSGLGFLTQGVMNLVKS